MTLDGESKAVAAVVYQLCGITHARLYLRCSCFRCDPFGGVASADRVGGRGPMGGSHCLIQAKAGGKDANHRFKSVFIDWPNSLLQRTAVFSSYPPNNINNALCGCLSQR